MAKPSDPELVRRLKAVFLHGWKKVFEEAPNEQVYAAGFYTTEMAESAYPFVMGEVGLGRTAERYVREGTYTPEKAADELRWSTGDAYWDFSLMADRFDDRPDVHELAARACAREVRFRLDAMCQALRELDAEGLFGEGAAREAVTVYIEGGDVDREWLLTWAKKLNPKPVFQRFAKLGTADEAVGTFSEFGTKKVYETRGYAQSADGRLLAAVTDYALFVFDVVRLKQLIQMALPSTKDSRSLGSVAMAADGSTIVVSTFGSTDLDRRALFLLAGKDWNMITTIVPTGAPSAVLIAPDSRWIACLSWDNRLELFDSSGGKVREVCNAELVSTPGCIASNEDGSLIATRGKLGVTVWNARDLSEVTRIQTACTHLSFGRGNGLLVCRAGNIDAKLDHPTMQRWDAVTGKLLGELGVAGYRLTAARMSPSGQYLACVLRLDKDGPSNRNTCALVELKTGKVLDMLRADFEQVRDFAFIPERLEIAVAVLGHTRRPLVLWKPAGWDGG